MKDQRDKAHILLVEDDENFGALLKNYLSLSGYQVVWERDGNLGFSRFRQSKFDLCLLDVMMPWRDGFTLAGDIRELNSDIPIIFLTARGAKEDQIKGYKSGGDDYLTKPFDSDVLLMKIETMLRRFGNRLEQEVFEIGAYQFIPRKRLLTIDDEELKLSPKESDLLKILCAYPNEVMPRRKALMEIWQNDDYFATRSMDVYVAKLRKRFVHDPRIQIENLHGSGYVFRIPV